MTITDQISSDLKDYGCSSHMLETFALPFRIERFQFVYLRPHSAGSWD